jgi:hypothetical protein
LDQAFALNTEALVVSWPLPGGRRLLVRMLSSAMGTPFVGESILLFSMTRQTLAASVVTANDSPPAVVYMVLALYVSVGGLCIWFGISPVCHLRASIPIARIPESQGQLRLKWNLCALGLALAIIHNPLWGLLLLLLTRFLPVDGETSKWTKQ